MPGGALTRATVLEAIDDHRQTAAFKWSPPLAQAQLPSFFVGTEPGSSA